MSKSIMKNNDQEILNMLSNTLAVMVNNKTQQLILNDADVLENDFFENSDAMYLCKLTSCFKTILDLKVGIAPPTITEQINSAEDDKEIIERFFKQKQEDLSIEELQDLIKIQVEKVIEVDFAKKAFKSADKKILNNSESAAKKAEEIVNKVITDVENSYVY